MQRPMKRKKENGSAATSGAWGQEPILDGKAYGKEKKWYQRSIAIALLTCCVLAILPANLFGFAQWIIRETTTPQNVNPTTGDLSVNYKFFANNMYIAPDPTKVVAYEYYQYVDDKTNYSSSNENYNSIFISKTESSTEDVSKRPTTSNVTGSVTINESATTLSLISNKYCACTRSIAHAGSCDHEGADTSMTPKFDDHTAAFSIPSLSIYGTLFDMSVTTSTSSVNLRTNTSTVLRDTDKNSKTYIAEREIADGVDLVVVITYTSTVTVSDFKTNTLSEKCGAYAGFLSSCSKSLYQYTAKADVATTATYYAYVRKTVGDSATWESGQILDHSLITDEKYEGVFYTVENLQSGSIVTAPDTDLLKSMIPATDASFETSSKKETTDKILYSCILYPIGYYTDQSKTTAVKFPLKVTQNTEVWVEWGTANPQNTVVQTDFNDKLANTESGELSLYDIGSVPADGSGFYTARYDKMYVNGSFGLCADINSDVTLKLCMNDGRTNVNVRDDEGNELTPTLDDNCAAIPSSNNTIVFKEGWSSTVGLSDNVRDYTVSLQNDISVSGTLQIGGHTGVVSNGSVYPHGYIVKNYVALDLNGHVLTVESGGILESFGYIYDSVGTGKIVVKSGGTMYAPLVIYGWHGTANSLETYALGYSPFEDYNLPYVETTVEIETDQSNSGSFIGRAMWYTTAATNIASIIKSDAAIINLDFHFFGKSNSSLFSTALKGKASSGKVTVTTLVHEQIQEDAANIKNIFTFENITSTFTTPVLKVGLMGMNFSLALERARFPISPMVDIHFKNSDITLNQQIMLMPGSTMTFDKNSVLNLGYSYVDKNGNHIKTDIDGVSAVGYSYVDDASMYLVGGVFAPSYNFQNMQVSFGGQKVGLAFGPQYPTFWNVFDRAVLNVYGTVNFKPGNKSAYILSGNVNVSSFSVNGGAPIDWELSNLTKANLTDKNVALSTYGAIAVPGYHETDVLGGHSLASYGGPHTTKFAHYYCLPMISNGKAYIVDASGTLDSNSNFIYNYVGAMEGTYDVNTGIFTRTAFLSDGTSNAGFAADTYSQCIILPNPDTSVLGGEENKVITFATSIAGVTMVSNELVSDGAKQYVYYAGTYSPVSGTAAANATTCTMLQTNFITDGASKTYALKWSNGKWVANS